MPIHKRTLAQHGQENSNGNHQTGSSIVREATSDNSKGDSGSDTPRTRRRLQLTPEADTKRAARRKALTLRALNTAYENHRGQQSPSRKTA